MLHVHVNQSDTRSVLAISEFVWSIGWRDARVSLPAPYRYWEQQRSAHVYGVANCEHEFRCRMPFRVYCTLSVTVRKCLSRLDGRLPRAVTASGKELENDERCVQHNRNTDRHVLVQYCIYMWCFIGYLLRMYSCRALKFTIFLWGIFLNKRFLLEAQVDRLIGSLNGE